MDELEKYRAIIKRILNEYAQYKPSYGEVEKEHIVLGFRYPKFRKYTEYAAIET